MPIPIFSGMILNRYNAVLRYPKIADRVLVFSRKCFILPTLSSIIPPRTKDLNHKKTQAPPGAQDSRKSYPPPLSKNQNRPLYLYYDSGSAKQAVWQLPLPPSRQQQDFVLLGLPRHRRTGCLQFCSTVSSGTDLVRILRRGLNHFCPFSFLLSLDFFIMSPIKQFYFSRLTLPIILSKSVKIIPAPLYFYLLRSSALMLFFKRLPTKSLIKFIWITNLGILVNKKRHCSINYIATFLFNRSWAKKKKAYKDQYKNQHYPSPLSYDHIYPSFLLDVFLLSPLCFTI